jgi:hypothetical protein
MLELVKTETPQVTVIPKRILLKVLDLLDKRNIHYEYFIQNDFKNGWPGWAVYRGETFSKNVYAIVACVTPESLIKAAEDMYHMNFGDIK